MWFQKKKPPPAKPPAAAAAIPASAPNAAPYRSEAPSSHALQQLERRLKKLEEELSQLTSKHPQIHIDNVHIHQPVLDNLTFRLDALDIKELSGSLNLGNNFGTKPNEKNMPGSEAARRTPRSAPDGAPASQENEQKARREPESERQPAPNHEAVRQAELGRQAGLDPQPTSGREPESARQPGPGTGSGASPERTATGYRFTPQSKTK